MKKCFVSFTTLFLALSTMPTDASTNTTSSAPGVYKQDWCLMEMPDRYCKEHNECDAKGAAYEWDEKTGKCISLRPEVAPIKTKPLGTETIDPNVIRANSPEVKNAVAEINKSAQNVHVGSQIQIPYSLKNENITEIDNAINNWISKCESAVKSVTVHGVDAYIPDDRKQPVSTMTCLIKSCESKYTKSKDSKSCSINSDELSDDEKSLKQACEKDGYFFDKNKKKCVIEGDEHCPLGTELNETTNQCEYVKQGPFPDNAQSCHNGAFKYYTNFSGSLKNNMESNFKEWQDACKSLAGCKNASENTWHVSEEYNDKNVKIYSCIPKTCLPDYPNKEDSGCTANAKQDEQTPNDNNAKFIADIDTFINAFNSVSKKLCEAEQAKANQQQAEQAE